MCGRFALAQSVPQYRAAVREQLPDNREPTLAPDADDYYPSYNLAPQTRCPVVRRELTWERSKRLKSLKSPTAEVKRYQIILQTMRWGLIPRFHKKPPTYAEAYKTINARDDTILSPQRSMWHPLIHSQRCVVFVQGFYEWQKKGDGDKVERIPHFVGMTEPGHGRQDKRGEGRRLMPLAGLWERVRFDGEDKPLYTFTIVTTSSNDQLGFLHDRMPVILPTQDAIATWLGLGAQPKSDSQVKNGDDVDDSWTPEVAKLLRPLKGELECYKVPKEVGKVGNSDPSFILPVEERKDGLKAFFAKQQSTKTSIKSDPDPVWGSGSDALMSGSSGDTEALLAAQQAEEDAARARADQEKADRKLAEQMQRDFEQADATHRIPQPLELDRGAGGTEMSRSESIVNIGESSGSGSESASSTQRTEQEDGNDDIVHGSEVGDGFAVPASSPPPAAKRARTQTPSTRFSPDPYNPPLSPPWPKGGYSRQLSPASGGGVHVNPARGKKKGQPHEPFPQAPPHTWKSPPKVSRGPMDRMLEQQQRRAAERAQEEPARQWKQASASRGNEGGGDGEDGRSKAADNSKGQNRKQAKQPPPLAAAAADIRSFFSPNKKK